MKLSVSSCAPVALSAFLLANILFASAKPIEKELNVGNVENVDDDLFDHPQKNQGTSSPFGNHSNGEEASAILKSLNNLALVKDDLTDVTSSHGSSTSLDKRAVSEIWSAISVLSGFLLAYAISAISKACSTDIPVLCILSFLVAFILFKITLISMFLTIVFLIIENQTPEGIQARKDMLNALKGKGFKIPSKFQYIFDLDPFGNGLKEIKVDSDLQKRSEEVHGIENIFAISVDETKFISKDFEEEQSLDVALIQNEETSSSIFFKSPLGYHIAIPASTISKEEFTRQILHSTPNVPQQYTAYNGESFNYLSFTFEFDDQNKPFYQNLAARVPESPVINANNLNNLNSTTFCGSFKTGPYASDIGVQYHLNTFGNLTDVCRLSS